MNSASPARRGLSIGQSLGLQAHGRPAPTEESPLRRRRPTPGAQRLERPISIGAACSLNSAHGRPAPTEESPLRRRRPTPGAQRPERPISIGAFESLRPTVGLRRPKNPLCVGEGRRPARSAPKGRFQSAREPSARGRPAPTEESPLRRRRPTPGAQRPERPISIGVRAFGPRSACADRRIPFASAKADARRAAPRKADFNRREAFGPRSACTPNEFGLQRPAADGRPAPTEESPLRRRRPTPGAQRLGLRRPKNPLRVGEGRFQSARKPSARGRPASVKKTS
jgi:hypothetical protein